MTEGYERYQSGYVDPAPRIPGELSPYEKGLIDQRRRNKRDALICICIAIVWGGLLMMLVLVQ